MSLTPLVFSPSTSAATTTTSAPFPTMPEPVSPISQVLLSIGLTRDDLLRHSDQMRQFLTHHDPPTTRPFSADPPEHPAPPAGLTRTRSVSRSHASAHPQTPPPSTPVKAEPVEPAMPLRQMDSMEMILERKSRQAKREKKAKGKDRPPPSPSPARASFSLDAFMQSRDSRRVAGPDQSDSSSSIAPQVSRVQPRVLVVDIFSRRTRFKARPSRFPPSLPNIKSTIETTTRSNLHRAIRRYSTPFPDFISIDLFKDSFCSRQFSHPDTFPPRKYARPSAICTSGRGSFYSTSNQLLQVALPFLFSPSLISLCDTLHEADR